MSFSSQSHNQNPSDSVGNLGAFAGTSVPFVLQTAIDRAASGKRQIRPKIIHEEGLIGLDESDEDDPDFDLGKSKAKGNNRLSRGRDSDSSGGEEDDSDSDSTINSSHSNNENRNSSETHEDSRSDISKSNSSDSDSSSSQDESRSRNKSLRDTLRKLNQDIPPALKFPYNKTKRKAKGKARSKSKKLSSKLSVKTKKPPLKNLTKKTLAQKSKKSIPIRKPASTIVGKIYNTELQIKTTRNQFDVRKIDLLRKICSVCLGERSDDSNEIIECDSCGQTVHEGCYGISDIVSISSGESDSITEPWFCDYCKNPNAGTSGTPGSPVPNRPMCSVCPNSDGLLKETVQETFIHLVCALYIPGVISPIDGKLTIAKIPSLSWGAKPCIFCTDSKDACTGVTIKCDAGMCKSQFHPTCAQKLGLLSESTEEVADPYFANCKMHGVKDIAKNRAKLYKILQEQVRIRREKRSQFLQPYEQATNDRTQRKLVKLRSSLSARRESQLLRQIKLVQNKTVVLPCNSQNPVYAQLHDYPKLFRKTETSLTFHNLVSHRLECQGENPKSLNLEDHNEKIIRNIKKRWNVQPNFNIEFIAYYFDRESRIRTFTQQNENLFKENQNLGDRQHVLSKKLEYDSLEQMKLNDSTLAQNGQWSTLKNSLLSLSTENDKPKLSEELQKLEAAIPGRQISRATRSPPRRTPGKSNLRRTGPARLTLSKCSVCHETSRQHLITRCDKCKRYYHLGCLDPPLTRMPKRTKLVGWACSDCNESENSTEEISKINTMAPRALRKSVKKPEKYRESLASPELPVGVLNFPLNATASVSPVPPTASSITTKQTQNASLSAKDYKLVPCEVRVQPMETNFYPAIATSPAIAASKTNGIVKKRKNSNRRTGHTELQKQNKQINPLSSQIPNQRNERKPRASQAGKNIQKSMVLLSKDKPKPGQLAKKSNTKEEPNKNIIAPSLEAETEKPNFAVANNSSISTLTGYFNKLNPLKNRPKSKKLRKAPSQAKEELKAKKSRAKTPPEFQIKRPSNSNEFESSMPSPKRSRRISGQPPGIGIDKDAPVPPALLPKLNGIATSSSDLPIPRQNGITTTKPSPESKVKRTKKAKLPSNPQETNFNNLITSGQISAALNYNSSSTTQINGKCDTCKKPDNKDNLVKCDDCKNDFHFSCVPPHTAYNPKRRGFHWSCPNCENEQQQADYAVATQSGTGGSNPSKIELEFDRKLSPAAISTNSTFNSTD